MVIMVMGVSGVGKTTIGEALAARLGWTFLDADDDHSDANKAKMHAGIPLTDADREPWLRAVGEHVNRFTRMGKSVVLACSALKETYRKQLRAEIGPHIVVYLTAPREVIAQRMKQRKHHFMNSSLLGSQIATLEEPADAIEVDASGTPDQVVKEIIARIDTTESTQL